MRAQRFHSLHSYFPIRKMKMQEDLFKHQVHPKKVSQLKLYVNNTVNTSYVIDHNQ